MPDPVIETPETEETNNSDTLELSDDEFAKLAEPESTVAEPAEPEGDTSVTPQEEGEKEKE